MWRGRRSRTLRLGCRCAVLRCAITTTSGLPYPAVFDRNALALLRVLARGTTRHHAARQDEAAAWVAVFDGAFFQLPASTVRPSQAGRATAQQPAASAALPTVVLMVDDDVSIREVVQLALLDEGYEVLLAEDGQRALELVDARQPSIILVDMNMPVMDGPAFCDALADHTPATRPTIVVMTASDRAHAFREHCHANDELGKPFELDELYAVVRRAAA
jgi:two-component system, chemotaxis family, chemotaxis protein CheY